MVQLYVIVNGETLELDLYDADPIKVTMSVEDPNPLVSSNSDFTKTFRLPQTKRNNTFFKGAFNADSITFDATKMVEGYIVSSGLYFMSGNIRLINIYLMGKDNEIDYEIVFMGDISNMSALIGEKLLSDLDLTEYNHTKKYSAIKNSWNATVGGAGLLNGDILYPLIEWGYYYDINGNPTVSTISEGFTKSFSSVANPLDLAVFKPCIRAKVIFDKILSAAGYSYNSAFLDSDRFRNLYLVSDSVSRGGFTPTNTAQVSSLPVPSGTVAPEVVIEFSNSPTIFYDQGNNINAATGIYTAPITGSYQIGGYTKFRIIISHIIPFTEPFVRFELFDYDTGATLITVDSIPHPVGTWVETLGLIPATILLAAGQRICTRAIWFGDNRNILEYDWGSYTVLTAPAELNMTSVMPANYKQADFLKSIIDRFKLVLTPDRSGNKILNIEPWNQWISSGVGENLDWSKKLDESKEFKISPLFYTQKKELLFNDQEDTDYPNFFFQQDYKKPYGQLRLDSGIQLIRDTNEIKGVFAPTPIDYIPSSTSLAACASFFIPHIAKDNSPKDNLGKREPIQPKPRLLFYNGIQSAPINWYMNDDFGSSIVQTTYPLLSNFEAWPPTVTTFDLNWKNEDPVFSTLVNAFVGKTSVTQYSEYWQAWTNMYYDASAKTAEGWFNLNDYDIFQFNFNERVFVKGTWWYASKISDFEIGANGLTKVTLIKIIDPGIII